MTEQLVGVRRRDVNTSPFTSNIYTLTWSAEQRTGTTTRGHSSWWAVGFGDYLKLLSKEICTSMYTPAIYIYKYEKGQQKLLEPLKLW